jgi:hypothetical protein
MKKFLIVSLAILFVAALMPQAAAAGVGVKGGYAMSKLAFTGTLDPGFVNLKAPMGGVFFGIGLGLFTIQPEILYVRMGERLEGGADWMEDRIDYIQVPLLLKVNVLPGPVSPMIFGGPYGSYRLAAKGVSMIAGEPGEVDLKDEIKTTDFGIVFGGGIDFKLGVVKLSAEVRYNLGLANIAVDADPGMAAKNKSLMFLAGIAF